MKRWQLGLLVAGCVLAVVSTVLVTVALTAPAHWAAQWVAQNSRVRLIEPQGTLWQGSAQVAFFDGRQATLMPGNVRWQLQPWATLRGALVDAIPAQVEHPALSTPLQLKLGRNQAQVQAGSASVSAALLMALGAPFNTVKPGGDLLLKWTDMSASKTQVAGTMTVDWQNAHCALSVVAPLGSYRVTLAPTGNQWALQLATLQGPLMLEGSGNVAAGKVQFSGQAYAQEPMRDALSGLIGVLGPRSGAQGERALLRINS